ncbi:MAG: hypothetical protein ACK4NO_04040 [Glycocaulis sp.]
MAIFARRRITKMLADIEPKLSGPKRANFVRELEDSTARVALAAECELAVLWALGSLDQTLVIEPDDVAGDKRPDGVLSDLFMGEATVVEITAISDQNMARQDKVDRAANIIINYCNSVKRGSGEHLSFMFGEKREYGKWWVDRTPFVLDEFSLTEDDEYLIKEWLLKNNSEKGSRLIINNDSVQVEIKFHTEKSQHHPIQSQVPAYIFHPEKNSLFRSIERKYKDQLRFVDKNFKKCLIIFDAGCDFISYLDRKLAIGSEILPQKVIEIALNKFKLDYIIVIRHVVDERAPFLFF